jgi:hypothetical protein
MEGRSARVVAAYRGSDLPAVITAGRMVTGSGLLAAAAGAATPPDSSGLRRYTRKRLSGFKVPAFWYSVGAPCRTRRWASSYAAN